MPSCTEGSSSLEEVRQKPPRVDDQHPQRPRMGSTCETTVGRGNGDYGTRGSCRHGGIRKRASVAPRHMTQMHPFAAIRCISRVSLQPGTAGPDPACVALHFAIVGAARTLFVIGSVPVLTDDLTALFTLSGPFWRRRGGYELSGNIHRTLQHVPPSALGGPLGESIGEAAPASEGFHLSVLADELRLREVWHRPCRVRSKRQY